MRIKKKRIRRSQFEISPVHRDLMLKYITGLKTYTRRLEKQFSKALDR